MSVNSDKTIVNDKDSTQSKQCENCQTLLQGKFCHLCGQDENSRMLAFSEFFMTLLNTVFSYDSKVNRTLIPLLIHPGEVCTEYLGGHRVRYIAPMRLYLFASVVFFLLLPWFMNINFNDDENFEINDEVKQEIRADLEADEDTKHLISAADKIEEEGFELDFLSPEQNELISKKIEKIQSLSSREITALVTDSLPTVMFFMIPLFALVLKVTNIFKGRMYSEHFVVALYAQSFVFIALSLLNLISTLGEHVTQEQYYPNLASPFESLLELGYFWLWLHLLLMQKSVYKQSWGGAIAKYFLNIFLYSTLLLMVFISAMVIKVLFIDV